MSRHLSDKTIYSAMSISELAIWHQSRFITSAKCVYQDCLRRSYDSFTAKLSARLGPTVFGYGLSMYGVDFLLEVHGQPTHLPEAEIS